MPFAVDLGKHEIDESNWREQPCIPQEEFLNQSNLLRKRLACLKGTREIEL